jgi:hypothetical protein
MAKIERYFIKEAKPYSVREVSPQKIAPPSPLLHPRGFGKFPSGPGLKD